jgi:predicted AlkP superfamily pyrophosphatase or phosphodiesterase
VKRTAAGLALVLTVALLTKTVGQTRSPSVPSTTSPKLILVLALDQVRYDYLPRYNDLYNGGLRRLIDHGAVFTNANYRHGITETGPGHSVMLSGRHPSHSGIVANAWWDPLHRMIMNVVDDPVQRTLGGMGRAASPANLVGYTVGDVLKQRNPDSHVVAASFKDRSAVLLAGHRGDAAYWFENDGSFVTSTYYMAKAPEWLIKWNTERVADTYAGRKWTRLLSDEKTYEKYAGRDDQAGEVDQDLVFPHALQGTPPSAEYYAALRNMPFADEVLLAFAIEAMKQHHIGQHQSTDLFSVGFSATDTIGHRYGPDSQEILDQLLRLDRALNQLFQYIDRSVGLANTIVIATADHGATPLIEALQAKGIEARRGRRVDVETALRQAFAQKYPRVQGLVADLTLSSQFTLYLDEDVIQKNNLPLREVEETAAKAVMSTGLFEVAYTKSDLLDRKPTNDPYIHFFWNSFFAPRSPNVTMMTKRNVSFAVTGTTHGTTYDYDRHVPIIFMGAGIKSGSYPEDCGPEDIAPTLAKILGFEYPKELDSRLLLEMLN